ncbi:MAG: hypothetical protein J6Q17_02955 [Clostridia bacterium]|nr:hypothetical protein [Clostridia bacterium]
MTEQTEQTCRTDQADPVDLPDNAGLPELLPPPGETDIPDTADHTALTERQKAAAYAMVRDGRRLGEIMEDCGMTPEEAVAWVRAGRFNEYVSTLARGFAEADAPMVWAALLRSAEDGNVPATRLYFDLMERQTARRGDPVTLPASPSEELRSLRESIFGGGAA